GAAEGRGAGAARPPDVRCVKHACLAYGRVRGRTAGPPGPHRSPASRAGCCWMIAAPRIPTRSTGRGPYSLTLGALSLVVFANASLQMSVAPALPAMQEHLGVSTSTISWVLTVTLLAGAVAVPIGGRLADIFGKNRVLLAITGTVALGC